MNNSIERISSFIISMVVLNLLLFYAYMIGGITTRNDYKNNHQLNEKHMVVEMKNGKLVECRGVTEIVNGRFYGKELKCKLHD